VELITALISFNRQLALAGLQLRILNGVVSLLTTRVENKALAAYVNEQSGESANLQLTTGTLEVLACIAFRQPISQAEIDRLFDADKRGLVVKLRDLKLVEEFAGADGRLRFATTEAFLQRFGFVSLQELTTTFPPLPVIWRTGQVGFLRIRLYRQEEIGRIVADGPR
jgi:segregation and condensation protein B